MESVFSLSRCVKLSIAVDRNRLLLIVLAVDEQYQSNRDCYFILLGVFNASVKGHRPRGDPINHAILVLREKQKVI